MISLSSASIEELTLFATTDPAAFEWSVLGAEQARGGLGGVTLVLRHPSGPVGFEIVPHGKVIFALIQEATIVDLRNRQRWRILRPGEVSSSAGPRHLWNSASCTAPSTELTGELEIVSRNDLLERKNRIRARHGRPLETAEPSRFDHWILDNDTIAISSLMWLVDNCKVLTIWKHSVWGNYAVILTRDVDSIMTSVKDRTATLGLPVKVVDTEAQLPVW